MSSQKFGKTFTEIYSEYSELKEENLRLKSETFRLNENLNSIVADINERAPLIKQAITDKRNLSKEVARLSSQLDKSHAEQKESQATIASLQTSLSCLESKYNASVLETENLSKQIQHLLLQSETSRISSGWVDSSAPSLENDTLFSNIQELQSQNVHLRSALQSSQESIEKLTQEKEALSRMKSVTVELQEIRAECQKLKENFRVSELKAGSYKRERDQIKWLLDNYNNKENSVSGSASGVGDGVSLSDKPENGEPANSNDYESMYKRLQTEFDEFRNETGTDTQSLKQRNEELMKSKNELEIHVVKLDSSLDHLQERYKSLNEHSDFQKKEKDELHNRINSLMDLQSSQEARMQELTNQYMEIRQRLDTANNELQYVNGEKSVIAASELRLQTENQELIVQRDLATEHLKRLQGMFEDGELRMKESAEKGKEIQKAYEAQLASIRSENLTVREEFDMFKLRAESEVKELQVQMERLTSQLQEATSEVTDLKAVEQKLAKTIEHTEAKLAESEESLARYTSREVGQITGPGGGASGDIGSVQALRDDLASTKIKLQVAQSSLESHKEHIEQYKAIAKAAEDKLAEKMQEFDDTFAKYRQETDEKLSNLQRMNSSLEKIRLDSESKLSQALEELSEQRTQIDKDQIEFLLERSRLEDEMQRLRTSENSMQNNYKAISNEVKKYKQRLSEARIDYEKVVLLESERIKSLEALRGDVVKANALAAELQHKANSAEQQLVQEKQTYEAKLNQSLHDIQAAQQT
ncbi:hypothetical protein BDR26DRAFT_523075 [Obelidium mucronatum]|nr:hypothetical protein BDR26DRAFT_523075 [Obelidium mucronatum]